MAWLLSRLTSTQSFGRGLAADEPQQQVARQVNDFAMVVKELSIVVSSSQATGANNDNKHVMHLPRASWPVQDDALDPTSIGSQQSMADLDAQAALRVYGLPSHTYLTSLPVLAVMTA